MKEKILYLECNSGISGDMTVAALLDLGADRQVLTNALQSLPLSGYSVEIKDVFKSGIRACDFNVILEQDNHDHDMRYLHGTPQNPGSTEPAVGHSSASAEDTEYSVNFSAHSHSSDHTQEFSHPYTEEPTPADGHSLTYTVESAPADGHAHTCTAEPAPADGHPLTYPAESAPASGHAHTCTAEPTPAPGHTHTHTASCRMHTHTALPDSTSGHAHTHHHDARNLNDITQIIHSGNLSERARTLAIRIFRILAEAEAFVHGKSVDEVHFHEVGAVDSIVDIVAAAVCIDNLNPDGIVVSALTDGTGQIRCQHGIIPVPVPAVAAIAVQQGIILKTCKVEGELVTPTGAAIAAAIASRKKLPDEYKICRIGFGAGKREYATTGLLRAMLIEPASAEEHDTITTLETNIDDCTGEALSYTMQLLFDAGALDVFFIPIYMKKNRPAYLLKVICCNEDRKKMEAIIFRNTTTIGIRYQEMHRTKLERRILAVETPWGMADIKCCMHGTETYYYPENDSVCQLAAKNGIGFPELYTKIQAYVEARNNRKSNAYPDA